MPRLPLSVAGLLGLTMLNEIRPQNNNNLLIFLLWRYVVQERFLIHETPFFKWVIRRKVKNGARFTPNCIVSLYVHKKGSTITNPCGCCSLGYWLLLLLLPIVPNIISRRWSWAMQNRSENQVCRDWVLLRSKISSDPSPLCVVFDHDAKSRIES